MFYNENEKLITEEFLRNGYIIRQGDKESLNQIQDVYIKLINEYFGTNSSDNPEHLLNHIHEKLNVEELNSFRLKIIRGINSIPNFRELYFKSARSYLEILVGNELAMQLRVNLSIQLPGDTSSLLPVHADTWSGDSPYEVVVWIPLVDCFGTKAMYILPPDKSKKLNESFGLLACGDSESLFRSIENDVKWLEAKFGDIIIFDQYLIISILIIPTDNI
jgi:sporadic carbohydrate cluster 2OG-Fe(II) oxygenase